MVVKNGQHNSYPISQIPQHLVCRLHLEQEYYLSGGQCIDDNLRAKKDILFLEGQHRRQ